MVGVLILTGSGCNTLAANKKAKKKKRAASKKRAPNQTTELVKVAVSQRRRGAVNKAINQAILREKIAARGHDLRANEVLKELRKIGEEVRQMKQMTKEDQAKIMTRIGALKSELDGHFKFLNKYLPDQRSVELTDPEGKNPMEAAARAWAEALSNVGDSW